jgi:tetratricopeptide (TPR) repeat protein
MGFVAKGASGALPLVIALTGCGSGPTAVQRAVVLSSKGQDRAGIQVLEADLKQHPGTLADLRLLVRLYGEVGDLGAAERTAGTLAARLPADSPTPWIELGHAFEIGHRYEEALAAYDKAASVAPSDSAGPRVGGMRAARWGEAELAEPRLEESLRRNARDEAVWHALGLVRLHLGDLDGAKTAYLSGLAADPAALEDRLGLATVALAEHRPAEALAQYDNVLQRRPSFGDGHLGRAWALIALGRYDDAKASLAEARRLGADARAIALQEALVRDLETKRGAARSSE